MAFEKRENIEYAHVATLQEVKDNDYNLNIPRYVDTFEAEAEIDLDAIAKQLQALEVESQNRCHHCRFLQSAWYCFTVAEVK